MRRFACISVMMAAVSSGAALAQEKAPIAANAAEYYARHAADADVVLSEPLVREGGGAWACASCHGDQGQGAETVPRLAGLPAGYIVKQLYDYREGTRLNDNMQYVVEDLSDAEMAALGRYYAEMTAPATSEAGLGGDIALGRRLALEGAWSVDLPSCFSCHGPSGWGVEQAFPPIAGQHAAYINTQLANWKSGRRSNSPLGLMHNVAAVMSENDMAAVSDYLATLPPVQPKSDAEIPFSAKDIRDE